MLAPKVISNQCVSNQFRSRLRTFSQMSSDRLLAETDAPFMPLPETHREFGFPPDCKRRADQSSGKYPISLLGIGRS